MDLTQPQREGGNRTLPALEKLDTFLPPSFELIPQLLLLLDDPEVSGEQLADLIRVDAGLTADVLQVANSALFSRGSRSETLLEAFNRIGLREVYRTVMRIIASPVLENVQEAGFAKLDLWRHSLATALGSHLLATDLELVEPDLAFTVGLLHDIGKVVLGQALGVEYLALVEEAKLSNRPLYAIERTGFGTDHAEIGAKLLDQWNFPKQIVSAIGLHHPNLGGKPVGPLAATTYAANVLAYRIGSGCGFPSYAATPDSAILREVKLEAKELFGYEGRVREALEREQMRLTP